MTSGHYCTPRILSRGGGARILARIRSAELGNFSDCKPVGEGVSEMRIDFGPGYRVHFSRRSETVYLLLVGGDKSTQTADIKGAKKLLRAFA
jgi:putative addiction module killer protein